MSRRLNMYVHNRPKPLLSRNKSQTQTGGRSSRKTSRMDAEIQAILDRASPLQQQMMAALRAGFAADARSSRAESAWKRMASFKADRIPDRMQGETRQR